jgi:hypothetical protein
MLNKDTKKCSTSLAIKEMQVKSTVRFISFQLQWPSLRAETTNAGKDIMKQEHSHTVCWEYKLVQQMKISRMRILQEAKNRIAMQYSDTIPQHIYIYPKVHVRIK